jgi:hypothetical protein
MNPFRNAFGKPETTFPDLKREEVAVVLCDIEAAGQTLEATYRHLWEDMGYAYVLLSVGQGQSMEGFPKTGITVYKDKSLLVRQEAFGERGSWKIDYCDFKNGAYFVLLRTATIPVIRSPFFSSDKEV